MEDLRFTTISRYSQRYEDIAFGHAEHVDLRRAEKFMCSEDCLDVLGIPKAWLRMVKPAELQDRKQIAMLTAQQLERNKK